MSTGFTLDGFPSMGAWVSYALGSESRRPAGVRRHPRPARRAADRARTTGAAASCPAVFQGTAVQRRQADPATSPARRRSSADADAATRDFLQAAQRRAPRRSTPATPSWPRASPATSWPRGCSSAPRRSSDLSQRDRRRSRDCTAPTTPNTHQGRLRPQLPARPPAARARRAVRAALQRRLRDGRGRRQLGRAQDAQGAVRRPRPDPRPARRRAAHGPEAARAARRHARRLGDRVRPDADVPEGRERPRPQPEGLHRLAGRRRREARASATARPTSSATRRSRNVATIYDLHATILHLLGLDHERLTFYHNGIERRLTDVHGEVVHASPRVSSGTVMMNVASISRHARRANRVPA